MHRYLIILEPTSMGYSAYSPDIPGCIATGVSQLETEQAMREAIAFHVDGLRADGAPIPEGGTAATYIEIAA